MSLNNNFTFVFKEYLEILNLCVRNRRKYLIKILVQPMILEYFIKSVVELSNYNKKSMKKFFLRYLVNVPFMKNLYYTTDEATVL